MASKCLAILDLLNLEHLYITKALMNGKDQQSGSKTVGIHFVRA